MPRPNLEEIKDNLTKIDQLHLLDHYSTLSDAERTDYLQHLHSLDLEQATALYRRAVSARTRQDSSPSPERMQPIPSTQFESRQSCDPATLETYRRVGLEAIRRGEVGVLLMAGGQGTRLGVGYPKGMISVGLPSGKTAFRLQAEQIRTVERLSGCSGRVTWYIMTSGPTDGTTAEYLRENGYFGLNGSNVVQFEQGLLPCFDLEGRILLEGPTRVALAPDGNGGIYEALHRNGILEDMTKRGIKYIHAHSVDNILTKVADPVFIGYCIHRRSDCGAKVVHKIDPDERLGVICQIGSKFHVVEYSELAPEKAASRGEDGNLIYRSGNICNHFFTREFLRKITQVDLKLHVAKKRIRRFDSGDFDHAPGVKIEKFVFDVFEFAADFVTWEVARADEFSPVKNDDRAGRDCPETAKRDLLDLHRRYVERAGGRVSNCHVEVSPLLSYGGEGLEGVVRGRVFEETTVLKSAEEDT